MTEISITPKERFAWAMFDFANSGYTTVVLTAIFNTYFVSEVAGHYGNAQATFIWTLAIAFANALVLLTAPIIGAIADLSAAKKRCLLLSTAVCVISTAGLAFVGSGDVLAAISLLIVSCVAFHTGENLISAFLPEIAKPDEMGRVSAYGWTLGYLGGLLVLGLCLVYVHYAQAVNLRLDEYVPNTMLIVAAIFFLASLPTFIWLKERAVRSHKATKKRYLEEGFQRLKQTLIRARQHQDLFRFLVSLTVYQSGVFTVVVLAAVYAEQVMGFETQDTLKLILVVNVTAALGAFVFGFVQDKIGAIPSLAIILIIWILALICAYFSTSSMEFWVVANLIGVALGSSQSASRAITGLFSPVERTGEFFGLWGLATKLAAIIGPLSYGFITQQSGGNHQLALLSTAGFFLVGLVLLIGINEQRGIRAAHDAV